MEKSKFSTQTTSTPGSRLRALRRARNINQTELGELIGCHKNSIGKWENDKMLPETPFLLALTELFHVSADYLLGLSNTRNIARTEPAPPKTVTGKALDTLVQQLASKDPDLVLLFARPFSDAELEMLTGAFRSVAAHRAEVAAEVEAARKTVPLDADPPLGMADGKDHVG